MVLSFEALSFCFFLEVEIRKSQNRSIQVDDKYNYIFIPEPTARSAVRGY